ncbi:hypothetical protein Q73_05745 [Bacillus coahuilensis m2-6]|uniref:hypothetical protein n=1 Tax=Bacillus coahuilensis TaxID=408580 RepID=UPI0007503AA3|nr:hypothetical protein [Bacillus coahuilensis]KUP08686.1 hypothetical protein Q73_05745 [Bacillus coahuilensis m2-6]
MKGTITWNLWSFLFGFSLSFFLSFLTGEPQTVLLFSIIWGLIFFIFMYVIRFSLELILQPVQVEEIVEQPNLHQTSEEPIMETMKPDSEEIAHVIQQLMNEKGT